MIISLQFVKVADTVFDYVIIILIWTFLEWKFSSLCSDDVISNLSIFFQLNNGDGIME